MSKTERLFGPVMSPDFARRANHHLVRHLAVQPLLQKDFGFSEMQIRLYDLHPVSQRGGSRSSRTRGGMRWTRMALLTRALEAYGEVVWSWHRGAGVKSVEAIPPATVAKEPFAGEGTYKP